jgi:TRAP-type C4-dicarboxylate transport system substrate-binding protein
MSATRGMAMVKNRILAGIVIAATGMWSLAASAEEMKLRAVSALHVNSAFGAMFKEFVDYVNANGKGLVQITTVLGPEAMPPFEVGNAVMTGVVDLASLPSNFYDRLVPTALAGSFATISPAEQRKAGAWDFMNKQLNDKVNAQMLAHYGYGIPMQIYTNKPIEGASLKGMRIRTAPGFEDLVRKLGGETVQMPPGEVYTALERGVVDGYTFPLWGIDDLGWHKFTKFRLDPGFWNVTLKLIVNQDKWKAMTPAQKDFLNKAGIWFEQHTDTFIRARNEQELKKQADASIKPASLSGDARKDFIKTTEDVAWEQQIKRDPADGPKLRQLLTK